MYTLIVDALLSEGKGHSRAQAYTTLTASACFDGSHSTAVIFGTCHKSQVYPYNEHFGFYIVICLSPIMKCKYLTLTARVGC